METPREVLFRVMHDSWAISNKDLARAILMEEAVTSGKSPQELIEVRSSLSRFVVHVHPGEYTYGWLAPFESSVSKVMSLVRRSKKPHSSADIVLVLAGEAARDMRVAFDAAGLDGALYSNAVELFARKDVLSTADASELLLSLFVVAGCSGSPVQAVEYAVSAADRMAGAAALRTAMPDETLELAEPARVALGMYRCEGGMVTSEVYRLDEGEHGTEIGSISLTGSSINDVGYGVSRRHARVWRDAAGEWWVEGLGSTNGTVHVSGADGVETVVEPPRSARSGASSQPVRLLPGDRLVLAGSTEFVVVALPAP